MFTAIVAAAELVLGIHDVAAGGRLLMVVRRNPGD